MLVKLHANAATTPKIRAYIQASSGSVAELASELGLSETTIRRWKGRRDGLDRSSRPHTLATDFSLEEEAIAVELRTRLGLSLDDSLEVMRRCLRAEISRSALHRCLKRHGVSARPRDPTMAAQRFAPEPFGYVHADLKHLPRLKGRPAYVFVAIERVSPLRPCGDRPGPKRTHDRRLPRALPHGLRPSGPHGPDRQTARSSPTASATPAGASVRAEPAPTPSTGSASATACATSSPGPTGRRPTAWPNASTDASPRR